MSSNKTIQIPPVRPNDWVRLRIIIDKLKHLRIGGGSTPEFAGLTLTGLTGVLKATAGVIAGGATHAETASLQGGTAGEYYHLTSAEHTLISGIGGLTPTDGNLIVGDGAAWVVESGATARTSIGLGTSDSPQFTNLVLTGDCDVAGDIDVVGDAAFGTAVMTPLTGIGLSKHKTITSAGDNSVRRGIYASVQIGKTGLADYTGYITGVGTQVQLDDVNTQDWTHANAIRGFNADVNTESSSAGTVTGISGYNVSANIQDAATVTNFYGYKLGTIQAFGNKLINAYGIKLDDVDAALTLNYAIYTGAGLVHFGDDVNTTEHYEVDGTQVVSNQGAAVADATDAADVITQLNALLARCRAHGLIAT